MKKLLLIPAFIFPYTVCLFLGWGFGSENNFSGIVFTILGVLVLVTLLSSFVCNLIYIFSTKEKTAEELLKIAFLIKAVHIPTYVLVFILGVLLGLMFFMTMPAILLLVFIDLLTLWISGMISIYSLARALKEGKICPKPLLIITMVCQLFFCVDIITLFVVRIIAKKNRKNHTD